MPAPTFPLRPHLPRSVACDPPSSTLPSTSRNPFAPSFAPSWQIYSHLLSLIAPILTPSPCCPCKKKKKWFGSCFLSDNIPSGLQVPDEKYIDGELLSDQCISSPDPRWDLIPSGLLRKKKKSSIFLISINQPNFIKGFRVYQHNFFVLGHVGENHFLMSQGKEEEGNEAH